MTNDNLILDLIVADEIRDDLNGPYVHRFSYSFIFDFLSGRDQDGIFNHGTSGSYAIIKKRRHGEEGRTEASYAIPIVIEGEGFSSLTCPGIAGNYTDEELHERLPTAIRGIDGRIRGAHANGLVLATERSDAGVIQRTFEKLGYNIHLFEKQNNSITSNSQT